MHPQERLLLDLPEEPSQIAAVNVECLVEIGERPVDIFLAESDATIRRRVRGLMRARGRRRDMRITPPRNPVKGETEADQQDRVQRHRHERKEVSDGGYGGTADHCDEGGCAARRAAAVALNRSLGDREGQVEVLESCALARSARGDLEGASRLLEVADGVRASLGTSRPALTQAELDRHFERHGGARATLRGARGRAMTLEEAVDDALGNEA